MLRVLVLCLLLFPLVACSEPPTTRSGADWASAELRARMQANGRFASSASDSKLLPPETAERLARAYLRTFGQLSEAGWSDQHGTRVRASELRRCGRAHLAQSRYSDDAVASAHAIRNYIGPQYLMHLCGVEGRPQVFLAVSARDAGLQVTADGRLIFPSDGSAAMAVYSHGIYPVSQGRPIVDPEVAAKAVFDATNLRIASEPVLRLPAFGLAASLSVWEVQVESSNLQPRSYFFGHAIELKSVPTVLVGRAESSSAEIRISLSDGSLLRLVERPEVRARSFLRY